MAVTLFRLGETGQRDVTSVEMVGIRPKSRTIAIRMTDGRPVQAQKDSTPGCQWSVFWWEGKLK